MKENNEFDVLIIGGGINGTGIAADAASRGLSVVLCEQNDLASGTSSMSSKLIHGGLRYLEYYEIRLVQKALKERATLMRIAPHLIHPLEIIMPYNDHLRPAWMLRFGLFLYDHLTRTNYLPKSKAIKLQKYLNEYVLRKKFTKGFSFYDCFTDDARLVVANAKAAKQNNAIIRTRNKVTNIKYNNHCWKINVVNQLNQQEKIYHAKVLINASGPWLNQISSELQLPTAGQIQQIKGSHIVVPKFYHGDHAFLLQHQDKRIIFIIPYQKDYALIGTTDEPYTNNPEIAEIAQHEIQYLCDTVNNYFIKQITPNDIVWTYSGVRPIIMNDEANPQAASRDYQLLLDTDPKHPPLLSVLGGKITTYRTLAENAVDMIKPFFTATTPCKTAITSLPGGNIPNNDIKLFQQQMLQQYSWLPATLISRYIFQYGADIKQLLTECVAIEDMGIDFGNGLFQREVEYLIENEWAQTSDDILWRRSKLGLVFTKGQVEKLNNWLNQKK